jgi:hypothetical protein
LKPAIYLYKKLGFLELKGIETPYSGRNIQMALNSTTIQYQKLTIG